MPDAGPVPQSIPQGVSADGSVVVGYNQDSINVRTAWRWTSALGYQAIAPTAGVTRSDAFAVSANGQTIVGQVATGALPNVFVWTAGNGAVTLPVTTGSGPIISADGSTVAGSQVSGTPFLWTAGGGVQNMNSLPDALNLFPAAITSDGSIIFGSANDASNTSFLFRYENGVMTSLGAPLAPPNTIASVGLSGATADGALLVGNQFLADGTTGVPIGASAWIWTSVDGFASIDDVFASNGIDLGNFNILSVDGISPDGTTFYGQGVLDGNLSISTWVAIVPEPSYIPSGLAMLAAVAFRRRGKLRGPEGANLSSLFGSAG